jgi:hypothetical protein
VANRESERLVIMKARQTSRGLQRTAGICFVLFVAALIPFLGNHNAFPQSCTGNANTLFYAWRTESTDRDTAETHVLLSEQFRMNCTDLLVEELSFHAYVRALKDFAPNDSAGLQKVLKIHNMYAQYSPIRYASVRLGRQNLSFGVARGSLDGATVSLKVPRAVRITGFVGLGVSGDSLTVRGWSEGSLFGGQFAASPLAGTDLAVSFISRSVRNTNIHREASVEARYRLLPGLRPSIGIDYDLLAEELKKVYLGFLSTGLSNVTAYANCSYTKPIFPDGSFFEELEPSGIGRVRLGATCYPGWIASLSAVYVTTAQEDRVAHYIELSADQDWISVGTGMGLGYGGARSGLFASIFYPLTDRLDVAGGVDYARYKKAALEDESDREDDLAVHLGTDLRFLRELKMHSRIEYLLNEEYDIDIRFLSVLSVGFGR